ncbi:hypothetical protein [Streptomyces sp. bgisy153]|uniref:hypothetical protein n=1 Tax=Streptomyces sp. bgisy153 TaxID=3413793 RepID=UPI003D714DDF
MSKPVVFKVQTDDSGSTVYKRAGSATFSSEALSMFERVNVQHDEGYFLNAFWQEFRRRNCRQCDEGCDGHIRLVTGPFFEGARIVAEFYSHQEAMADRAAWAGQEG